MTRGYALAIFASTIIAASFVALAEQPKVGSSLEGGKYLFREAVEGYWNDWIGFPVMIKTASETGQSRVTIVGEGKTATFIGNLSINCENGKYYWESAGSASEFLTSESQTHALVPRSVISNAIKLFCKKS